jgi:hypothetical protein
LDAEYRRSIVHLRPRCAELVSHPCCHRFKSEARNHLCRTRFPALSRRQALAAGVSGERRSSGRTCGGRCGGRCGGSDTPYTSGGVAARCGSPADGTAGSRTIARPPTTFRGRSAAYLATRKLLKAIPGPSLPGAQRHVVRRTSSAGMDGCARMAPCLKSCPRQAWSMGAQLGRLGDALGGA